MKKLTNRAVKTVIIKNMGKVDDKLTVLNEYSKICYVKMPIDVPKKPRGPKPGFKDHNIGIEKTEVPIALGDGIEKKDDDKTKVERKRSSEKKNRKKRGPETGKKKPKSKKMKVQTNNATSETANGEVISETSDLNEETTPQKLNT